MIDAVRVLSLSDWQPGLDSQPPEPFEDESPGIYMLYSSGSTGKPKGVRLPLPTGTVTAPTELQARLQANFAISAGDVYLSPAALSRRAVTLLLGMSAYRSDGRGYAAVRSAKNVRGGRGISGDRAPGGADDVRASGQAPRRTEESLRLEIAASMRTGISSSPTVRAT
jgi:hypothetical protein